MRRAEKLRNVADWAGVLAGKVGSEMVGAEAASDGPEPWAARPRSWVASCPCRIEAFIFSSLVRCLAIT